MTKEEFEKIIFNGGKSITICSKQITKNRTLKLLMKNQPFECTVNVIFRIVCGVDVLLETAHYVQALDFYNMLTQIFDSEEFIKKAYGKRAKGACARVRLKYSHYWDGFDMNKLVNKFEQSKDSLMSDILKNTINKHYKPFK